MVQIKNNSLFDLRRVCACSCIHNTTTTTTTTTKALVLIFWGQDPQQISQVH